MSPRQLLPDRPLAAIAAMIVSLLCLPGCISGLNSKTPPEQRYMLPLVPVQVANTSRPVPADASVKVLRPQAAASLAGPRIAVLKPGARFDYYANARWIDAVPALVETALVDALRSVDTFASVESDAAPFQARYLLSCDIRDFQAEYLDDAGEPPTAVVDLDCTLGRRSDRGIELRIEGRGTAKAQADRMEAVVAAFGKATHDALVRVVQLNLPAS